MIEVGEVAMVALNDIYISDRTRKEFGDLEGLEESLKTRGLIAPLAVVRSNGDKPYILLAGERRYIVLQKHKTLIVPVRIYPSDISPMERKAIELAENLWRKAFEYWEHDALIDEIHKLHIEIHGKRTSPVPDAPGWTQENTADLMGITRPAVTTALKRAAAREALPDIFTGCVTQKDANRVLDKLTESAIKEALAKKIEQSMPSSSTLQRLSQSYILEDFFTGIAKVPDSSVHLVEIDPPYGIDLRSIKKQEGSAESSDLGDYNEVDAIDYISFMPKVLKEAYRVMTDHSWLICWFGPEPWAEIVYQWIIDAGFKTTRLTAFWPKGSGQSKCPTIRLANSDERFYYASKGSPALARPGHTNEFRHAPVPSQKKIHPTERPVELMKDIYSTFTWEGSRLLIPFLGSGSGLIAAHELKINAFGYELSSAYRDAFLLRINSLYGCEL